MRRRYPALDILIVASKVLGVLLGLLGGLTGLVLLIVGLHDLATRQDRPLEAFVPPLIGLGTIAVSAFVAVCWIALGEWIELHLTLEANTRPRDAETLDAPLRWVA